MKQHLYGQKNRASNYMILSVTRFDPPALHHIKNEMPEGISFLCVNEEGENVIMFGDKWFRNVDDFFKKAQIDGKLLTEINRDLYDFRRR